MSLQNFWNKLLINAKQQDRMLAGKKSAFANQTKADVGSFKTDVKREYNNYKKRKSPNKTSKKRQASTQ